MVRKRNVVLVSVVFVWVASVALGQIGGSIAWDDPRISIEAKDSRVEQYRGRSALVLEKGIAWLDDAGFGDGAIEFDVAAPAVKGFHGVVFRAVDHRDYEHVYIRPHLSGHTDAVQYTPVFHGVSAWQICAGEGYAGAVTIDADRWVHVRLDVAGSKARLSVDGQEVDFPGLQRPTAAGGIGLMSSAAPARFANLVVTPFPADDGNPLASMTVPSVPRPEGLIERWRVSTPFAASRLALPEPLSSTGWSDLRWDTMDATVRGIANLAILRERNRDADTVFAAVTLRAAKAGPATIRFGFSDSVVVYLNGRPIYRGDDTYASRDYRFLGTMGLWDGLILPLEKGDNELRFAVSEGFGGWGVTAQLVAGDGVTVVAR